MLFAFYDSLGASALPQFLILSSQGQRSTTGDQNSDGLEAASEDLGQIILTIHETTLIESTSFYDLGGESYKGWLGEHEKKLMPHNIRYVKLSDKTFLSADASDYRLGEEMTIPPHDQSWYNSHDTQLVAKFIFKYQPLGQLSSHVIGPTKLMTS
jgi:hypothetical protein